ncbi:SDR family NAD(P)-dependent oxidoreductase [Naasia aerilata]|uniref:Short-chain dehydrogenase n=1 Tax=Naasia aerilata TaxID=1162966 RepID=A0ABM8GFG2_9MICO|nr:SDR family NAD(P)-dependent oxidoreductase [Naasia aerilata]BDZ46815.1 short-chain dehydrogenase [Naasia aerilata]
MIRAPHSAASPVVLTGGTSGVGRATALQLAARQVPLVLGVRNAERGEAVRDEILALDGDARVGILPLDLSSLASVREFAASYAEHFAPWRALIANAGVMLEPTRRLTADGFEMHLGVNHLAHFALTGLLLPFAGVRARVITVTSIAARWGHLLFHDLRFDHGYRPFRAYAASKRANLLFAHALHRKSVDEGLDIVSIATHPGYAMSPERLRSPVRLPARAIAQDHAAGAGPNVMAVLDPTLTGGELIAPGGPTRTAGPPAIVPALRIRNEEAAATRLWRLSGQLTRVPW